MAILDPSAPDPDAAGVPVLDRVRVEQVDVAAILPLRQRVLRAGTPSGDPRFDGDEEATTVHLAALLDGEVVGCSSWLPRLWPAEPERVAAQLRGMATDASLQGTGVGGLLLEAGVARAFAAGAEIAWANARDSALGFYRAHGFEVHGDGFSTAETAMPHHRIIRRAPAAGGGPAGAPRR